VRKGKKKRKMGIWRMEKEKLQDGKRGLERKKKKRKRKNKFCKGTSPLLSLCNNGFQPSSTYRNLQVPSWRYKEPLLAN